MIQICEVILVLLIFKSGNFYLAHPVDKLKYTRLENLYEGEFRGGTPSVAQLIEEGAALFKTIFERIASVEKHKRLGMNGDYIL